MIKLRQLHKDYFYEKFLKVWQKYSFSSVIMLGVSRIRYADFEHLSLKSKSDVISLK